MSRQHHYTVGLHWQGNLGRGTEDYHAYGRSYVIEVPGKPPVPGSSDPAFFGDATRYNPEEMFLASLAGCHMLWYLHVCSDAGVSVLEYRDDPEGMLVVDAQGGRFESVTLHPRVLVRAGDDVALARALHEKAHASCFIANSVKCALHCVPEIRTQG